MMKKINPEIEYVFSGSIAEESGIKPGEKLCAINGFSLRDIIDYRLFSTEELLNLEIMDSGGKLRIIQIEKDEDEDLGISFSAAVFDGIRKCRNHCIFCFVDQMIKGQRKSLYVKDDDYRLSFLYGNYITLTNLNQSDIERIISQHLSPLYISVHAVSNEIRELLLGKKDKFPFLDLLKQFSRCGIEMHGQVVLVPGVNDGEELIRTIETVSSIDNFVSLALVPVGLTKCKNPILKPYMPENAVKILDTTVHFQNRFLKGKNTRFVFPSDEFYLLAGRKIPSSDYYEDYFQIENGVGIIRLFYEEFKKEFCLSEPLKTGFILNVITGVDGGKALGPICDELYRKYNLDVHLITVSNRFFGETVTVTGLLTGKDIIRKLNSLDNKSGIFLLPDILLKHSTDLLLDDTTVIDIIRETECDIRVSESSGKGFAFTIMKILEGRE